MNYVIVDEKDIITNVIICESDDIAQAFNAKKCRDGLGIGDKFEPVAEADPMEQFRADLAYISMMTGVEL